MHDSCGLKHALVTGASSGIGRATALRLAEDGFHVFGSVRQAAHGEALRRDSSERVTTPIMDVAEPDTIAGTAEQIRDHVGDHGLDVLVNNAGVGVFQPLEVVPLDVLRRQFAINVDGQVAVAQAMLPMVRDAGGRIIMIGSIADRITLPFTGPTAASKHAIRSLTDAFRLELAPWGIPVILIEPASIRTDAVDKLERDAKAADFGESGNKLYGAAFTRWATTALAQEAGGSPPREVADTIAHAATARNPRTRYLTGKHSRVLAVMAKLPPPLLDRVRRRLFSLPGPGSLARKGTH